VEEIEKDGTLKYEDKDKLAVLHWDPIKNEFIVSVRNQKAGTWEKHILKTKSIVYNELEKEANRVIDRHINPNIKWVDSPLFVRKRRGIDSASDITAPIYVY